MTALDRYQARMQRVLDHIDAHRDSTLDLDTPSGIAAFYRDRARRRICGAGGIRALVQAAGRPVARGVSSITPLAAMFAVFAPLNDARSKAMTQRPTAATIRLVDVPDTDVALIEHHGPKATIDDTIRWFTAWRQANGLHPRSSATFTVFDAVAGVADDVRIDICAATRRATGANDAGVKAGLIPGGRCAVLRVVGSGDDLEPAASYLYRDWLPASSEEPRDFPLYCQRLTLSPMSRNTRC